ncbi:hypothetical protein QCH01_16820 [Raoultella ornithinolytica]|uniref:hypothetical protein n=4 Tax=Raoultella ornithinolytica TaxID=54291 RepID=UPI001265C7DE|nr:hypothetical protein [Raoultella ornithinolytica]KAB8169429.1 hypothetical protein FNV35_10655 [Raoultella ornithinolytica]QWU11857.1 hypothetical protein KP007_08635 [Raoultella ornithinolytica]
MNRVLFICVVYATKPEQTITINSLSKIEFNKFNINASFAIWDNSLAGYENETVKQMLKNYTVTTYHYGINEKLSIIYNKIINEYRSVNDWVVILDDDSVIDDEYMHGMVEFINACSNNEMLIVAVPKIYNNNIMISPGRIDGVRGFVLPDIRQGIVKNKNIVAMMSGTIISLKSSIELPKFDERLSFYGVDTKFFLDIDKVNGKKYILSSELEHNSALRNPSIQNKEHCARLINLFSARKVIFEKTPMFKLRLFVYKLLVIIKLIITRKSFVYFKLLFA